MFNNSQIENPYVYNGYPCSPVNNWDQDNHNKTPTIDVGGLTKAFGLAISLMVSPITVIVDPWQAEKRKRDATVTMSIYKEIFGRIVSRAEALQIAREILESAERERLYFADYEAARGIQWETHP
ncbi:hypothetical protein [Desulfolutivibrio sulfoxidireducens]|uniref:hypothetical protein n=1 Tax=Desulfolutivibrio sulfoxidireducens TaxID=2773299 RepID=UPI00159D33EF|nr:hypothetical protein [Desulfolutivibrio sulfoxidireducens]QLA17177.1 hypothetical protein GD605_14310 [Desulfolutivibrio sulfoxidireducens]